LHDTKLDALVELVEEANGKPVLVFYQFKHEITRIQQALKGYGVEVMNDDSCIDRWNRGEIPVLLAHPASTAYGLNMQQGGNIIIWYGLNWALELYQQANARLNRQGQTKPVHIYHLLVSGTMDVEVAKALTGKVATQDGLMDAIKAVVGRYK
jgi:SNF2 family DNA or RNA helicase